MTDDLYDIVYDAVTKALDRSHYVWGFATWADAWRAGRYDERYMPDRADYDAYCAVRAVDRYERAKRLDAILARISANNPQREWIATNVERARAEAREWAEKVGKDDDADV